MAKLSWNNLNRFQRNYVTKEAKVFVEVENNEKLNEEQKDVLFIEHFNAIVKADYTSYKFPTSIPTAGTGIKDVRKNRIKAPKLKASKAKAK